MFSTKRKSSSGVRSSRFKRRLMDHPEFGEWMSDVDSDIPEDIGDEYCMAAELAMMIGTASD